MGLLELQEIGVEPMEVYAKICAMDYSLADDKVLNEFFSTLHDKRYSDVKDEDVVHAEKTIYRILGGNENEKA